MNKNTVTELMERVNNYWIAAHPDKLDCSWENSTYFIGDMAAYDMTGKKEYLDYAIKWANENEWRFYNDDEYNTDNADSLLCGEIYLDLMDKYGIKGTDKHMLKNMDWELNDDKNDYWWWVDTMYMALNIYNRFGIRQKDERFFEKAYRLFYNTKVERKCYDEEYHLWFRDENYLPERARTKRGKKVFWSRGNGWVFAGLARTLSSITKEHKYFNEYFNVFTDMAGAVEKLQCSDGFWHTSLIEPDEFSMPETSGTVLFVLGYLQGIRNGLLDKKYLDCALRGFEALNNEAIDENGKIGWVQIVAKDPGVVKKENTHGYAVGAYLQVCRELLKLEVEKDA